MNCILAFNSLISLSETSLFPKLWTLRVNWLTWVSTAFSLPKVLLIKISKLFSFSRLWDRSSSVSAMFADMLKSSSLFSTHFPLLWAVCQWVSLLILVRHVFFFEITEIMRIQYVQNFAITKQGHSSICGILTAINCALQEFYAPQIEIKEAAFHECCALQFFFEQSFETPKGLCFPYVTRKTVTKNGATIAETIFEIVYVRQWNIKSILRIPRLICDFSPFKLRIKIV